jgi:hypothetical protein
MSVSDNQRREDKRRTLLLMLQELGDHHISHGVFSPTATAFADVLQTTWRELLDDGLIEDKMSSMGHPAIRLTPARWLRAMTISGNVDLPEIRGRCTRLAQTLKAVVKGRKSHYDAFIGIDEVAERASIPHGWVYNAVKARLLGVVFSEDRWDAEIDPKSRILIRVSPTFGLNHLFEE